MRWRGLASLALTFVLANAVSRPAWAQRDVLDRIILIGPLESLKTPGVEKVEDRPEAKDPAPKYAPKIEAKPFHRPLTQRTREEDVYTLLESRSLLHEKAKARPETPAANAPVGEPRPTSTATAPAQRSETDRRLPLPEPLPPPPTAGERERSPAHGLMESIGPEDPGPPGGLTLDAAIERLVHVNRDLLTKYHEIPQAQADLLTAGLRENPLIFWTSSGTPYGQFSNQPGTRSYPIILVYSLDLTGRRKARIQVAQVATRLIEARYQDEVRRKIDLLQTTYIEVLSSRATVRSMRASRDELEALSRWEAARGGSNQEDLGRLSRERLLTEIALDEAEGRLREAKRDLCAMLDLPRGSERTIELYGTLRGPNIPPPPLDGLIQAALTCRPDLAAQRLSVRRSQAVEHLEETRRLRDTYLVYEPWSYEVGQTNQGERSSNVWGIGVFAPLPLFDRNQGNIQRARIEVGKMQSELGLLEREVAGEVEHAVAEYDAAFRILEKLERELLPLARRDRDSAWYQLTSGAAGAETYLSAQRGLSTVARIHREASIRHRRAALLLNTTVGHRVFP